MNNADRYDLLWEDNVDISLAQSLHSIHAPCLTVLLVSLLPIKCTELFQVLFLANYYSSLLRVTKTGFGFLQSLANYLHPYIYIYIYIYLLQLTSLTIH